MAYMRVLVFAMRGLEKCPHVTNRIMSSLTLRTTQVVIIKHRIILTRAIDL